MTEELMARCQQRKQFKVGTEYEWRWVEVPVAELTATSSKDIRCAHCHGAVRVHRKQVEHGPQDHVEHLSRQDSENCRGGMHFKGQHRLSTEPVI